jgi:hypothetical protein
MKPTDALNSNFICLRLYTFRAAFLPRWHSFYSYVHGKFQISFAISNLPSPHRQYVWIPALESISSYRDSGHYCYSISQFKSNLQEISWQWHLQGRSLQLTNRLYSKVLLANLTGPQLAKKSPALYRTRRIITASRMSLSWSKSIQSTPLHPIF